MVRQWLGIIPVLALSGQAVADQYHYQNVLIGDRAMGMGGAFGAVSDDASGVYYNPAGIAFALSNDISGSANANVTKKIVYKDTIGGEDFVENSSGAFPAFFGGLQKLDSISKKLVFAFGVYTVDGELRDQDDLIRDRTLGTDADTGIQSDLVRFHRANNVRATTSYAGAALGYRLANNMAIGLGLNYATVEELTQNYQDVHQRSSLGENAVDQITTINSRENLAAFGLQATLGFQMTFANRFSLGFTQKFGTYVSQSFEQSFERRVVSMPKAASELVQEGNEVTSESLKYSASTVDLIEVEKPLGTMPAETRLAFAWFASTRALLTLDIVHYGAVSDADPLLADKLSNSELDQLSDADKKAYEKTKRYNKVAVTNYHLGMEYYLAPAFPLRLGLFTNNTNTPEIDHNDNGQLDHVDFIGESIFLAWVQPNSQIGAGITLQQGDGEAQKLDGANVVQKVEANIFTFAFSATHSF